MTTVWFGLSAFCVTFSVVVFVYTHTSSPTAEKKQTSWKVEVVPTPPSETSVSPQVSRRGEPTIVPAPVVDASNNNHRDEPPSERLTEYKPSAREQKIGELVKQLSGDGNTPPPNNEDNAPPRMVRHDSVLLSERNSVRKVGEDKWTVLLREAGVVFDTGLTQSRIGCMYTTTASLGLWHMDGRTYDVSQEKSSWILSVGNPSQSVEQYEEFAQGYRNSLNRYWEMGQLPAKPYVVRRTDEKIVMQLDASSGPLDITVQCGDAVTFVRQYR